MCAAKAFSIALLKFLDTNFWGILTTLAPGLKTCGVERLIVGQQVASFPCCYNYYYPARACASKGLCDRSWCLYIYYPARACASKGLCDRSWCLYIYYPARACASKGLCDRSWCLYIVVSLDFLYLPKYSLSEVYFNTDRLLIEFNGLSYSLAARQVFVAIANPDSLSFG